MNSEKPSPAQNNDKLWEEYAYRHSHIWKAVFQLTAAVVALSIVPYLDPPYKGGLFKISDPWLYPIFLAPPLLAAFLSLFGFFRMNRELVRFAEVKDEYLKRMNRDLTQSKFSRDVRLYVGALCTGSVVHLLFLIHIALASCN